MTLKSISTSLPTSLIMGGLSVACVVHCAATPLLLMIVPALESSACHDCAPVSSLSLLLMSVSILCGLSIVYKGYCQHKKEHGLILYATGVSIWVFHTYMRYQQWEVLGLNYYLAIGTILVLLSYYINHKLMRCCPSQSCHPSCH